jgi:hypothetical protein
MTTPTYEQLNCSGLARTDTLIWMDPEKHACSHKADINRYQS